MTARQWVAGSVSLALVAVVVVSWVVAGAPVPWRSASPSTSAGTAEGKALYQTYCASCHGTRGEGQPEWKTKKADGTYPAPPQDSSGHTWHHADGLLFRIVREGGQAGAPPGYKSAMPAWNSTLSDAQIRATLEYIKTFWGTTERGFQTEVSVRDPYP